MTWSKERTPGRVAVEIDRPPARPRYHRVNLYRRDVRSESNGPSGGGSSPAASGSGDPADHRMTQ
eukprot:764501-Hanusia_phi.AAC.4